jgi:hypothetical protein
MDKRTEAAKAANQDRLAQQMDAYLEAEKKALEEKGVRSRR